MERLKTILWRRISRDSLKRNSILLILSQAVNAGSGFVFWIICAHLFLAKDIGLATALISFAGLIAAFTNFGLPNTVIRFLPNSKQKGSLFATSLLLILLGATIGSIIAVTFLGHLSPKLAFVRHDTIASILLALLIIGNTVGSLMDATLLAFRRGEYILGKALIANIPRLVLPFFVVAATVKGIVSVYASFLLIGTIYCLWIILRNLLRRQHFKPNLGEITKNKTYVLSNYFGGMFGILPSTLVPIIVLNKLGAEQAAFFYMPMLIATFLNIISSSTSQALISEASQTNNPEEYDRHFKNAANHLYKMLLPAIVATMLLGWPILRVFGQNYASQGYLPLLLLAVASVFVAVTWLGDTLLNIQKRSVAYFLMNGFNALAVVVSVYLFAGHGLIAVGLGWLVAQVLSAAVYLIIFARAQLLGFKTPS